MSQVVEWKHDSGSGMNWLCLCVIQYGSGSGSPMLSVSGDFISLPIPSNSVSTVLSWGPSWGSRLWYITDSLLCVILCVCVCVHLPRCYTPIWCCTENILNFIFYLHCSYYMLTCVCLPSVSTLTSCRVPVVMYTPVMWFTVGECDLMVTSF